MGLTLGACSEAMLEQPGDEEHARFLVGGKADDAWQNGPEAAAVLTLVNQLDYVSFVTAPPQGAGIHPYAAQSIIYYRQSGFVFSDLRQLDGIPYLGPVAFDRLLAHAQRLGLLVVTNGGEEDSLRQLVTYFKDYLGNFSELDVEPEVVQAEALDRLHAAPDPVSGYYAGAWHIFRGFPNGHGAFYANQCGTPQLPSSYANALGACFAPYRDSFVVTAANDDNPLGLQEGDVIESVAGYRGQSLFDLVLETPVCGGGLASQSALREHVADALPAILAYSVGAAVEVREPQANQVRSLVVPPQAYSPILCTDPLGRDDHQHDVRTYRRPDGIAVIRLPSFNPSSVPRPEWNSGGNIDAYLEDVKEVYRAALREVQDAPAIIWDARANQGGVSPAALEIVAGMPTARATELSYCDVRIPGSQPASFYGARQGEYSVEPGGAMAYGGKVAVLVDGRSVSAGDYFALAVKKATDTLLVGSETAGGYGTPGAMQSYLHGLQLNLDTLLCFDAQTGAPLETHGVQPDLAVEYDPLDLARGIDTVLEAAAQRLLAP